MTDEQVNAIVNALQNSGGPWWGPWALAGASAVIGFVLGVLGESVAARRRRREERATKQASAVRSATEAALRLTSSPPSLYPDDLRAVHAQVPAIMVGLNEFDPTGTVSAWWLRQLTGLMHGGTTGDMVRAQSVDVRLRMWADGRATAAEFGATNDADWDAAWARHHAEARAVVSDVPSRGEG